MVTEVMAVPPDVDEKVPPGLELRVTVTGAVVATGLPKASCCCTVIGPKVELLDAVPDTAAVVNPILVAVAGVTVKLVSRGRASGFRQLPGSCKSRRRSWRSRRTGRCRRTRLLSTCSRWCRPPVWPSRADNVTEEKSLVTMSPWLSSTATSGCGVTGENAVPPVGVCSQMSLLAASAPFGEVGAAGSLITVVAVWGWPPLGAVELRVSVYCWGV